MKRMTKLADKLDKAIDIDDEGNVTAGKNIHADGLISTSEAINDYNKNGELLRKDGRYVLPIGWPAEYVQYSCVSPKIISGNGWVDMGYRTISKGETRPRRDEVRMARVMPLHAGKITASSTLIYTWFYFNAGALDSVNDLSTFMRNNYGTIQASGHIGDDKIVGLEFAQQQIMAITEAGNSIALPTGSVYSEKRYGDV